MKGFEIIFEVNEYSFRNSLPRRAPPFFRILYLLNNQFFNNKRKDITMAELKGRFGDIVFKQMNGKTMLL